MITTLFWFCLLPLILALVGLILLSISQQRKRAVFFRKKGQSKPVQPSGIVKIKVQFKRKPLWVIKKVIYLKAMSKHYSCRQIAEAFNRLYSEQAGITISKSFVAYTIRKHKHQIHTLRKKPEA